jgi:hypothetical protein
MPQLAAQPVNLHTKQANVTNNGEQVMVSLPINGSASSEPMNLLILEATLDGHPTNRALPAYVEAWSNGAPSPLFASFSLGGLVPGSTHTVRFKGTYKTGSATQPFQAVATITIPPPVLLPVTLLKAIAEVHADEQAGLWSYTLRNTEPAGSTLSLREFNLPVGAPFVVKGTPRGWKVQTDNLKFVLWSAENPDDPAYLVPPGESLDGFQIQSGSNSSEGNAFSVHAWNTRTHVTGPVAFGTVLVPRAASH